jgi:TolB-like protein/Flp pilus assembly protein TadD
MPPDSPSYVERAADRELFDGLCRGDFCYVLTASQMGKSSLMAHTAKKLRAAGLNVVVLDLTNLGTNITAEQWYFGLMAGMGRVLSLEDELDEFWEEHGRVGPVQRILLAFQDVILPALKARAESQPPSGDLRLAPPGARLIVFIDEINVVRGLPFNADDFFMAIKGVYDLRQRDPEFNRLTFCLIGIATPSDLIRDTFVSTPFNIGHRIELADFTPESAARLAFGLQRVPDDSARTLDQAQRLLERVLFWTHGHPYLTQRLCLALAQNPRLREAENVDYLCANLFFSSRARDYDENLLFVRGRLLGAEVGVAEVLKLYSRIWNGEPAPDDETNRVIDELRLAGLVRIERGLLVVRNRIYQRVFDGSWIKANLPAERPARPGSIAVLPFRLIGPDSSYEYLADGLTDELSSALGRVAGLRVASPASAYRYKDRRDDVRKMGSQLMVEHIVEGIVRQNGTAFQISAQLVGVANGHSAWSETYTSTETDLAEIQNKITAGIVGQLKPRAATLVRPAANTEAYNLYLKGRFHWNHRTELAVRKSIDLFQQAAAKDAGLALAHAGLADAFNLLATYNYARPLEAYPKAEAAAIHAIELDDCLAQAHCALGCASAVHRWDWERAERAFRRAIELNPSYAPAHQWYAINLLTPLGRHNEALAELRRAQEVDPLSISITASVGLALHFAGRHGEAIEQCQQAVELDPAFWLGYLFLGRACLQQERFGDAVSALQTSLDLSNHDPVALAALAQAYAMTGDRSQAAALLGRLDELRRRRYVPAMDLAPVYLALDDLRSALAWLNAAVAERSFKLIYLMVEPRLQKLRSHPQLECVARQIGLLRPATEEMIPKPEFRQPK